MRGTIKLYDNASSAPVNVAINNLNIDGDPSVSFASKPALYINKTNLTNSSIKMEDLYYNLSVDPKNATGVQHNGTDDRNYVKVGAASDNMKKLAPGEYAIRANKDVNGNVVSVATYNPSTSTTRLVDATTANAA